eukprot:TRINITY_DN1841_c0_g1_i2.p1 TRINITY_DN1841_c0_g1~~TRINITY_DN1841_c0_g1_i2.p1  ORF type:complete len:289 (+),score=51.07 TRINITY_DN1841_c0_g1_i2:66-932(+)
MPAFVSLPLLAALLSLCLSFGVADIATPGCANLFESEFNVRWEVWIWKKSAGLRVGGKSVGSFVKPCPARLNDAELFDSGDNFNAKADIEAFSWANNIRLLDCHKSQFASLKEASDKVWVNKVSIETEYQVFDSNGALIGFSQKTGVFNQEFTIMAVPSGQVVAKATKSWTELDWKVQIFNRTEPAGDPRIIAFAVATRIFSGSETDSCTKFVWYGVPILSCFVLMVVGAVLVKFRALLVEKFPCCRACCRPAHSFDESLAANDGNQLEPQSMESLSHPTQDEPTTHV